MRVCAGKREGGRKGRKVMCAGVSLSCLSTACLSTACLSTGGENKKDENSMRV